MDTPKNASWVVRKIIDSREVLINSTSATGLLVQEMEKMEKQGKFQIKTAYHYLQQQHPRVPWKSLTLHKHLHPRHRFHLWLAVQHRLSTVDPTRYGLDYFIGCTNLEILAYGTKSRSGFVIRQSREIA
ncbi:hypothetical protein KY290_017423 [Solanum tuberosum]|uniref:Reverse transcriptase zinc-binding domain-containing protein n=1 Tax=Solanum tuberosum TaxID=4113 RepID=A0ABQ7VE60_SOLTU|nr:hypothetical protein KY290_017423 [Solanum tuberosum]